jgi:4-hydroxyproline epimerase
LVGALLCKPTINECVAGVIFFNNVGYLNMCGHGTIGLGVALGHLGVITPGVWKLETPVGVVSFEYEAPNTVALENVPSYRYRKGVEVKLEDGSLATGDIAWGGNWFFLVQKHGLELTLGNVERLTEYSWSIRQALISQSITGEDGGEIDHVELFGSALDPGNQSRNFVLCPGKAYDRSPCGTGTSAKVACLAADGKLQPGEIWRQESIIGSVFEASYRIDESGGIIPKIKGTAYVNGEGVLLMDEQDPFRFGIRNL